MKAVVNASPLIFLAKLDRLDLLPRPSATTPRVLEEIRAGRAKGHPEAFSVEAAIEKGDLVIHEPKKPFKVGTGGLHAGEASVLALASERGIQDVVLDDRIAIRTAKLAGLSPLSTPFIMLRALREGRLKPAEYRGLLERLVGHGYFLSAPLYARLLDEGRKHARER